MKVTDETGPNHGFCNRGCDSVSGAGRTARICATIPRPFSCSFQTGFMSSATPSVVAAATTLAEWARDRRRLWSDVPLNSPAPSPAPVFRGAMDVAEPFAPIPPIMTAIEEVEVEPEAIPPEPMMFEPMAVEPIEPEPWAPEPMVPEPVMFAAADEAPAGGPSAFERA